MKDLVLAHGNIVLTHGDIYSHGNQKKKFGGAIKPNDTNIMYGSGILNSQLGKLNFNTDKKNRNVRLRL